MKQMDPEVKREPLIAFEVSRELSLAPGVGAAWVVVGFGSAVALIALVRLLLRGRVLRAAAIFLGAAGISLVALVGGVYWGVSFFMAEWAGVSPAPGIGLWLVVLGSAGGLTAPLISGPD